MKKASLLPVLLLAFPLAAGAQTPAPSPAAAPAPVPVNQPLAEVDLGKSITDPALRTLVTEAKAATETNFGKGALTTGDFVTSLGQVFIPVQVFFSEVNAPAADAPLRFFGVLEQPSGATVMAMEEPVTLVDSNGDRYYDRSLVVPPGTYNALFGLADAAGKAVWWQRTQLVAANPLAGDMHLSGMILSNNLYAMTQAQRETDPFAFGGVKVVPKGDLNFVAADGLWYFFNIWNPGLDATSGEPALTGAVEIQFNGKPRARLAAMPLKSHKLGAGRYALGNEIPLASFKPGSYEIAVTLKDTVKGKELVEKSKFYIRPTGTKAGTPEASPAPPPPPPAAKKPVAKKPTAKKGTK